MRAPFQQNISLAELIPKPHQLKMLILHSPFRVNISHISLCHNLIKLDISNNRISALPSFQDLSKLRILHLHQNQLARQEIQRIFDNQSLNENLLYITLWNNPLNSKLIRHWLANRTQVKIIDTMIVHWSERTLLPYSLSQKLDSYQFKYPIYNIQQLQKDNKLTQQNYEHIVNEQIKLINQRHDSINPVIIIQKHFKMSLQLRKLKKLKCKTILKIAPSVHQVNLIKRFLSNLVQKRKMRRLLTERGQEHLLGSVSEYRKQQCRRVVHKYAQRIREQIKKRKQKNKYSIMIYRVLANNYYFPLILSSIQEFITYPVLYFQKKQLALVQQLLFKSGSKLGLTKANIFDFCKMKQTDNILFFRIPNVDFGARALKQASQFIRMQRSVLVQYKRKSRGLQFLVRYHRLIKIKRKWSRPQKLDQMSKIKARIEKLYQKYKRVYSIQFKTRDLAHIFLRLLTSYNKRVYQLSGITAAAPIIPLFKRQADRTSAAIKIQKKWKAYKILKGLQKSIFHQILQKRAAVIIQKFFRQSGVRHQKIFQIRMKSRLEEVCSQTLYFPYELYFNLEKMQIYNKDMKLPKQNSKLVKCQKGIRLIWHNSFKVLNQYRFPTLPFWIPDNPGRIIDQKEIGIYELLHYQASLGQCYSGQHKRYISFTYQSVTENRIRGYILSLLLYRLKKSCYFPIVFKQSFQPQTKLKSRKINFLQDKVYIDLNKGTYFHNTPHTVNRISLKFYPKNSTFKLQQDIYIYITKLPQPQSQKSQQDFINDIQLVRVKTIQPHIQKQRHNRVKTEMSQVKKSIKNQSRYVQVRHEHPEIRLIQFKQEQKGEIVPGGQFSLSNIQLKTPFNHRAKAVSFSNKEYCSTRKTKLDLQQNIKIQKLFNINGNAAIKTFSKVQVRHKRWQEINDRKLDVSLRKQQNNRTNFKSKIHKKLLVEERLNRHSLVQNRAKIIRQSVQSLNQRKLKTPVIKQRRVRGVFPEELYPVNNQKQRYGQTIFPIF